MTTSFRKLLTLMFISTQFGCIEFSDIIDQENARLAKTVRTKKSSLKAGDDGGGLDHYIEIEGRKGASSTSPGHAFTILAWDLWSPFAVEGSGGVYDQDVHDNTVNAICGIELDGRSQLGPPAEFYGIAARIDSAGMTAYAYTHHSSTPIGTKHFPSTSVLDFRIESNSGVLTFLARPDGASVPYATVATFAIGTQNQALVPGFGAFNIQDKKARIGFDDLRVTANSPAPISVSPTIAAAHRISEAGRRQLDALHRLDGSDPDFLTAAIDLATAMTHLDQAIADVSALETSETVKNALTKLKKARKRNLDALDAIADTNAWGAMKRLAASARLEISAARLIYPLSN